MPTATYSLAEVARHNRPSDLWLVIDGDVYDLTDFAEMHPGPSLMHAPPRPAHTAGPLPCALTRPPAQHAPCVYLERNRSGGRGLAGYWHVNIILVELCESNPNLDLISARVAAPSHHEPPPGGGCCNASGASCSTAIVLCQCLSRRGGPLCTA